MKSGLAPEGGWQAANGRKTTPPREVTRTKRTPTLNVSGNDILKRQLVWRLSWVDNEGPWSLINISRIQMTQLIDKMISFESMTVGEIFGPGSEHGKSYTVSDLPNVASRRIKEIKRDDEDQIHRLRCSGTQRLYGVMREHVFHVLWWDPEHEVWPSTKRNT